MTRFVFKMPEITEKLPVCPDGTDIGILYYLFSKNSTPFVDVMHEEQGPVVYCKEIAYAYKSLMKHTNIAACGRVRIFADTRCYSYAKPYFEQIGLLPLVRWISVCAGWHYTGYMRLLSSEEFAGCRYTFFFDADHWFAGFDRNPFDFTQLCAHLDGTDELLSLIHI